MQLSINTVLLFLNCSLAAAHTLGTSPVSNVLTLLDKQTAKVVQQGEDDDLEFQKSDYECRRSIKSFAKAVADGKDKVSILTSDIKSKKEEDAALEQAIADLEVQLGTLDQAQKSAEDVRNSDKALYEQKKKDLESTIEAVGKASKNLQEATPSESLVQIIAQPNIRSLLAFADAYGATSKDSAQKQTVASLLQDTPREKLKAEGDKDRHTVKYTSKTTAVKDLLGDLKRDFTTKLHDATMLETRQANTYDLQKKARDHEIKMAKTSKTEKTEFSSQVKEDIATLTSDLKSTQEDLDADKKSLSDTQKNCMVKKQEYERRSAVRKEEIKAIGTAKESLQKATGFSVSAPATPALPPSPQGSLVQLPGNDVRSRAVNLLRAAATTTHSRLLQRLAQELSLHTSEPFDKVSNMLEKMIFHLMDEQTKEDEHKNWCDREISKSNITKSNKMDKVQDVQLKIDAAQARMQRLANDITDAETFIGQLVQHMNGLTETREIGKKANKKALKEAKEAQKAIADACASLSAFYAKSGSSGAASFIQLSEEEQPQGMIDTLQSAGSQFAKMEADTRAQEEVDSKNYLESMKDSKIEKARRAKEVDMKSQERKRLQEKTNSYGKTEKLTSSQLKAVEQYLKDLEPACVEGDSSYDERKTARDDEIEALKKVKKILADAAEAQKESLLQKSSRTLAVRRL